MLLLATPAELNKSLQRTVDPDAATLALASATGMVRDYCGWSISEETVTFTVDGSGTTLLSLPTLHLTAVYEARLFGEVLTEDLNGRYTELGFQWSQRGQLYRAAGWPDAFRCAEVDVTHGYAVTPDAVRAVVLALAGGGMFNPGGSLVSKTVGSVTHTYRDAHSELTELQTFQLSGYRL